MRPAPTTVRIDERTRLTLAELAQCVGLPAESLITLVDQGLLEPEGAAPQEWRFDVVALRRARIACRLQQDLEVNTAGAALAVELLEELRRLRRRVRRLEMALGD